MSRGATLPNGTSTRGFGLSLTPSFAAGTLNRRLGRTTTGAHMVRKLRILLVGGPMYDPLYERIGEFEEREGMSVEVTAALAHPELNERIEEEFGSRSASYDLI